MIFRALIVAASLLIETSTAWADFSALDREMARCVNPNLMAGETYMPSGCFEVKATWVSYGSQHRDKIIRGGEYKAAMKVIEGLTEP